MLNYTVRNRPAGDLLRHGLTLFSALIARHGQCGDELRMLNGCHTQSEGTKFGAPASVGLVKRVALADQFGSVLVAIVVADAQRIKHLFHALPYISDQVLPVLPSLPRSQVTKSGS